MLTHVLHTPYCNFQRTDFLLATTVQTMVMADMQEIKKYI